MRATYPCHLRSLAHCAGRMSIVVAVILAVLVLAAACGSSAGTTTTGLGTNGGSGAQVVLKNLAFDPVSVTIKAGGSVTWANQDSVNHTVVGDNGEFQSGNLSNGGSFTFTFDEAGSYTYHCGVHPAMKGTVVVE